MENAWFSIISVCSCLRVAEGNTVIAAMPRRCHKNIQHALHNEHSFNYTIFPTTPHVSPLLVQSKVPKIQTNKNKNGRSVVLQLGA
jgi:hypothetical protein